MLAWAKTIEQMPLAAEVFEQTATRDLKQPVTPKPDEHRQKHWVVFSPGEPVFSFLAVYSRHCPCILPRPILS